MWHKKKAKTVGDYLGDNAYGHAVLNRGRAFIEAANIILLNTRVKKTKEHLTKRLVKLQEKDDSAPKTKLEKAKDNLQKIKEKWESLGAQNAGTREKDLSKKDIQGLMGLLTEVVKPYTKSAQKSLERAENHSNWEQDKREPLKEVIDLDENTIQVRMDEPITRFTVEQEKQWLRILEPEDRPKWWKGFEQEPIPQWFKALEPWEKNLLRKKVKNWLKSNPSDNRDERTNLGDYLGVPPTTIRGYPGARNAYKSYFYTYKKKQDGTFGPEPTTEIFKIRSGHIAPDIMENREEPFNDEEILEAAKENIKQLILAQAQEMINQGKINLLFDLQTLITPPMKPEDIKMDSIRLRAVSELRREFRKTGFVHFLRENGIKGGDGKALGMDSGLKCTLLTSNHPVNSARTWSHVINFLGLAIGFGFASWWRYQENQRTMQTLETLAKEKYTGIPSHKIRMANAALEKIRKISGFWQQIRNKFEKGMNHNAERAALEQIAVSGLGGVRIGSCMSGKDREGGVSEHVAAISAFYGKHGYFPPIPPLKEGEKDDRNEYERMVAQEFLAGYEQRIADANAPGASGLKDVKEILGEKVMKKVKEILIERAETQDEKDKWENCKISELTESIATLNRIKETNTSSKTYKALKGAIEGPSGQTKHADPQAASAQRSMVHHHGLHKAQQAQSSTLPLVPATEPTEPVPNPVLQQTEPNRPRTLDR